MSTPETLTLTSDTRFKLREILRDIPGSHEQWADIQDVLDEVTVDAGELLRVLATVRTSVRTIVTTTDRELAKLRRERDTVRSYLGTGSRPLTDLLPVGAGFVARAINIEPFGIDTDALTRWIYNIGADAVMNKLPVYGHPLLPDSTTPTAELADFIQDAIAERVLTTDERLHLDLIVADSSDGLGYHIRIHNQQRPTQRFGLIGAWTAFEFANLGVGVFDQAVRYLADITTAANAVMDTLEHPQPIPGL